MTTGIFGGFSYLLVGWCGILVPSLVRSIEASHQLTDAEFGVYYLVFGVTYAAGSLGGGAATERAGRRPVLALAAGLLAAGLVAQGLAPSWAAFLLAAVPAGLGVGALDGGANGLFLDVFRYRPGPGAQPPPPLLQPGRALRAARHRPAGRGRPPVAGRPGRHGPRGARCWGRSSSRPRCPTGGAAAATPPLRPGREGPGRGARAFPGRSPSPAWRSPATSPPRWASPTGWSASSTPPR